MCHFLLYPQSGLSLFRKLLDQGQYAFLLGMTLLGIDFSLGLYPLRFH